MEKSQPFSATLAVSEGPDGEREGKTTDRELFATSQLFPLGRSAEAEGPDKSLSGDLRCWFPAPSFPLSRWSLKTF